MSELNRIAEVFARLGEPVFLVRQSGTESAPGLTLHTMERRNATRLASRAREALRREGSALECRVVTHNPRALRRIRSLEALARRFGEGRVVYDPTGFVGRSEAVADCARRLRASLGSSVQNVFLDTSRRTLYVIVQESASAKGDEIAKERAELVRRAGAIMRDWQQAVGQEFALAVRIGAEPPRGVRLVSVDAKSVTQTIYTRLFERKGVVRGAIAMGAAALLGTAVTVPAAAAPAVSNTNGTVMVRGGSYDFGPGSTLDNGQGDILGKVTFPLGPTFGGQVEGGFGTDEFYGVGGQLFWRDPNWAMAGVYVSHDSTEGFELTRYGAQAELYVDKFTFLGRIGDQTGDFGDGLYGSIDVSFFLTPNLVARGGIEHEPDDGRDTVARLGFEWQPAMDSSPGLSVFADGEWGDDYDHVRAGLKIHFGSESMTIIDRERKADPAFVSGNRRDYGDHYSGPVS
jgi:hypothetical protein